MVGNLKVSSEDQAKNIEGINQGISEIEDVTQRNAASAEETASISEELYAQVGTNERVGLKKLSHFVGYQSAIDSTLLIKEDSHKIQDLDDEAHRLHNEESLFEDFEPKLTAEGKKQITNKEK